MLGKKIYLIMVLLVYTPLSDSLFHDASIGPLRWEVEAIARLGGIMTLPFVGRMT